MSPSGQVKLKLQKNGNLIIKDGLDVIWSTGTSGTRPDHLEMQNNGNLVLTDTDGNIAFESGTGGYLGAKLLVKDDGSHYFLAKHPQYMAE